MEKLGENISFIQSIPNYLETKRTVLIKGSSDYFTKHLKHL